MTTITVGAHTGVPLRTRARLATVTSGVCRCGAVYDNGNVAVPAEYNGLCGRCAFRLGLRFGGSRPGGDARVTVSHAASRQG
jgi:hypothetical protein